jgi:hypothetical protein
MWQSATWNGQESAFRFYVTVLAVLIFVKLPDNDLPETEAAKTSAPAKKPAPAKKAAPKRKSTRAPARRRTDKGRRRTDTA